MCVVEKCYFPSCGLQCLHHLDVMKNDSSSVRYNVWKSIFFNYSWLSREMAGSIPQALSFLFHLLSVFVRVHTVAVSMWYGWVRALCLSMHVHALVSCVCVHWARIKCVLSGWWDVMGYQSVTAGVCEVCAHGVCLGLCVCAFWGVCEVFGFKVCVFVCVHCASCVCVCVHCIRGVCIGWEIAGRSRAPWQQVCGGDMDTLSLDLSVAIDLSPSYLAAAKTHRSLLTEANYTSLQHHHTKQNKANTSV